MTNLLKILIKLKHESTGTVFQAESDILDLFSNLDQIPSEQDLEAFLMEALNEFKSLGLNTTISEALIRAGANWAIREMRKSSYIPRPKPAASNHITGQTIL